MFHPDNARYDTKCRDLLKALGSSYASTNDFSDKKKSTQNKHGKIDSPSFWLIGTRVSIKVA